MEFEKRRNMPVKYNRAIWDKTGNVEIYFLCVGFPVLILKLSSHISLTFFTVEAMKRVEEIKRKRQARFIMNR